MLVVLVELVVMDFKAELLLLFQLVQLAAAVVVMMNVGLVKAVAQVAVALPLAFVDQALVAEPLDREITAALATATALVAEEEQVQVAAIQAEATVFHPLYLVHP